MGLGPLAAWATSCPPPRHNFTALPRIRSESPAFDLHHPDIVRREIERGQRKPKDVGGFEESTHGG